MCAPLKRFKVCDERLDAEVRCLMRVVLLYASREVLVWRSRLWAGCVGSRSLMAWDFVIDWVVLLCVVGIGLVSRAVAALSVIFDFRRDIGAGALK